MIAIGLLAAATAVALAIGLQGGDEVPPTATTRTTIAVGDTNATPTTGIAAANLDAMQSAPPIDIDAAGASHAGPQNRSHQSPPADIGATETSDARPQNGSSQSPPADIDATRTSDIEARNGSHRSHQFPTADIDATRASDIGAAKPASSGKPPVIDEAAIDKAAIDKPAIDKAAIKPAIDEPVADKRGAADKRAASASTSSEKPRAKLGSINIQATPWAHVYVGGKLRGTTPLAGLRLPIGQHKITLVNPELDVRRTVTVTVPHDEPYLFRLSD
jgi:hypothetical protein